MACNEWGLFSYNDDLKSSIDIPTSMLLDNATDEALLLRLFIGKINFNYQSKTYKQNHNYAVLPYKRINALNYKTINQLFNINVQQSEVKKICNEYFNRNRRNKFVHERLLNELSFYFIEAKNSPISAFVHLYRCLEFMSYSFPMMYAALSRNYKGTYESLKKFLNSSDNKGELKFFNKFISELFKDEESTLSFTFEIEIVSPELDLIRKESNKILSSERLDFVFTNSVFHITFSNMMNLFVCLRNRYFHMLLGSGPNNYECIGYDIRDFIRCLNPYFVNWLAVIYCKIIQYGCFGL